ncbi:hypothetical protein FRIGORI9N_350035 [Frigoribacterium sp. 9N]|nr:hypothetical protein FRIGORI9N_350035 [Frigoribacterium sp. 9N]
MRVGPHHTEPRVVVTRRDGLGRRRERESARPRARERAVGRPRERQRRDPRRCSRRSALRDDLVESADPGRQGRAALPTRTVAPPPRRGVGRVAGRAEEPGGRLPTALDERDHDRRRGRDPRLHQQGIPDTARRATHRRRLIGLLAEIWTPPPARLRARARR